MSQDNQNSQPPSSPEPKANRSEPTADRVIQSPQKPYNRVQPFWKHKIIQILRGTIGLLETTVVTLETAPPPATKETPNFLQRLQSWWSAALAKIRFLLPDSLSAKLSDTALTGILAGIIVLLVSINSSRGDRPNTPTEVANVPPQQAELPVTITTLTEAVPPSAPPTAEITPPLAEETTPPTEEITPPLVEETPPSPEPEPEPIPMPTPTIILTPEQNLIAGIENQVAEVSDRFASGLIKSIQANFGSSSLTLKISDDWYTLKQFQQDKLCDKMLQRSKELDFSHLEILDSQDRLVARNPVVGDEMVIFRRLAST